MGVKAKVQSRRRQPIGEGKTLVPVKRGVGRPSAYRSENADQVYKLCLLTATDQEIAEFFGVSKQTLYAWEKAHPEFLDSITRGKMVADANVAERLYQRAMGYEHEDVYPSSYQGAVTLTPIKKHYPPDTTAASLWLRNRQREKWRDRDSPGNCNGAAIDARSMTFVGCTPEQALEAYLALIRASQAR